MPLKREKNINVFTRISTITARLLSCRYIAGDASRGLRHSCDLRLHWNFPRFFKWSDCSGQAVRNSERVYTGPKKMETTDEPFPVRSHGCAACERRALCQDIMQDVQSPVWPNGRKTLAGQISWCVLTIMSSLLMISDANTIIFILIILFHCFLTPKVIWTIDTFSLFLIFERWLTWTHCGCLRI